jgi:hypothetical protein
VCREKWSGTVVQSKEAEKSCIKCDKKKRKKGWCQGCGIRKLNDLQLEAGDFDPCIKCVIRYSEPGCVRPEDGKINTIATREKLLEEL